MNTKNKFLAYLLCNLASLMILSITPTYAGSWFGSSGDSRENSDRHDNDEHEHGIKAVLRQLDKINVRMTSIESQLANIDAQLTPCTPDRFRAGLCGSDNQPFDLTVTICGTLNGQAKVYGDIGYETKLRASAGVGWKDGPDADVKLNGEVPAKIAFSAEGNTGLGMNACLTDIKIPLGKNIDRARILALLDKIELGAEGLHEQILAAIDTRLNTQVISNAIAGAETFKSEPFTRANLLQAQNGNPFDILNSPGIALLSTNLPIGDELKSRISDPSTLLPTLNPANALDICNNITGPMRSGTVGPICNFVQTKLPNLDRLNSALDSIDLIRDLPASIIEGVTSKIHNGIPPAVVNTGNRLCAVVPLLGRLGICP